MEYLEHFSLYRVNGFFDDFDNTYDALANNCKEYYKLGIIPNVDEWMYDKGDYTVEFLDRKPGYKKPFKQNIDTLWLVTTKFELGPRPRKNKYKQRKWDQ